LTLSTKFKMEHSHPHGVNSSHTNRAFVAGIVLNLVYVAVQIIAGLRINSLSLLSDAGHNFLDVSGLALSLLALRLTNTKATKKLTYGYKKSSILISLFNTVILLTSVGAIGLEAILRFQNPEPTHGKIVAFIALIGIFINGISAFLFFREKDKDINIRSAFLHLFSDTLISFGLVVGGILIYYTNEYWIDPLLSILICGVILWSTWNLLKSSLHLSMDGVPEDIDLEKIIRKVQTIAGVENMHHVHIWAISTKENAMTGHLVVSANIAEEKHIYIRRAVKQELKLLGIEHCTLEIETLNHYCMDEKC